MRQCTAIFLLSIFLFSNTEIRELGKIGAFVGHFQEHRAINPDISLLEFIHLHYFNGNVHDEDYARDMQLPFKVIDCAAPTFVCTIPLAAELILAPVPAEAKSSIRPADQSSFLSSYPSDIWQPPKSC
jgi:hypothetical protein